MEFPPLTWEINWEKLRDPGHWFDGNPPLPSGYYLVLGVACALLLIGIAVYNYRILPRSRATGLTRRLAGRFVNLVVPGLAVLVALIVFRFLLLTPLSARWLSYAALLYLAGVFGYFVWYRFARYPADRRAYARWRERQQFMPRAKSKPAPDPRASAARAARKKPRRKR
jgi:hypothetical protein